MATSDWVVIGVGGLLLIKALVLCAITFRECWKKECKKPRFLCVKLLCEYWGKNRPRLCFNEGFILDIFKAVFWFISRFSLYTVISFCLDKLRVRRNIQYRIVDAYIIVFALTELAIFIIFASKPDTKSSCVLIAFITYRLFDLFQVWVRHFVLPDWNPVNAYRSLILVFIGYLEVIILYTLLVLIFQNNFDGISCLRQAFDYSIRNAVTIGSSAVTPSSSWGYAIFVSQLMFVLLFLTSVVSRIIGRK